MTTMMHRAFSLYVAHGYDVGDYIYLEVEYFEVDSPIHKK